MKSSSRSSRVVCCSLAVQLVVVVVGCGKVDREAAKLCVGNVEGVQVWHAIEESEVQDL